MFDEEFQLNFRSKQPLADQLRDHIRQLIAAGVIQPGQQLPTVRQAAVQLGVNFNTVARAYRALDEAGAITTRQGRGTYVVSSTPVAQESIDKDQLLERLLERLLTEAKRNAIQPAEVLSAMQKQFQTTPGRVAGKRRRRYSLAVRKPGYPIHLIDTVHLKKTRARKISSVTRKEKQTSTRRRKQTR